MAKLLIFRGEAPHAEVELTTGTVRIGRSVQNDIVLEDPSKGVSRNHAEIRFEGGHHVLIDKESQNGIWVSGSRVSSVVLAPHVVASVGPFRLMIEALVPAAAVYAADTPTELNTLAERPTGPLMPDETPRFLIRRHSRRTSPSTGARAWHQQPRAWFIAGAVALLIAAVGFAVYRVLPGQTPPSFDLGSGESDGRRRELRAGGGSTHQSRPQCEAGRCGGVGASNVDAPRPRDCRHQRPLRPRIRPARRSWMTSRRSSQRTSARRRCSVLTRCLRATPTTSARQELAARAGACAAAMAPHRTADARCPDRRTGATRATVRGRARPAAAGTRQGLSEAEAGDAKTVR